MEEVFAKVMDVLSSIEGASVTVALILDFAFRMIPSKKPLTVMYVIGRGAGYLGEALVKFSKISDKVLPQNVKEE